MDKVAFVLPATAEESAEAEILKKNVYGWMAWLDAQKMADASDKLFKETPGLQSFSFNVTWEYDDEGGSNLEVYATPEMKVDKNHESLPEPMGLKNVLRSFVRQHMTPALFGIFTNGRIGYPETYEIRCDAKNEFVKDFQPSNVEAVKAHAQELNLRSVAAPSVKKKSTPRSKP